MRSTRDARERGTSVYFPAPRDPDAARALSNELCSLQAGRRPPVHGLRHGDRQRRRRSANTVSTLRSCIRARGSPTTQVWDWLSQPAQAAAGGQGAAAALAESARALQAACRGARRTRRDRFRHDRARTQVRRARQDRGDRAGRPQRCAQAHRGVHARGQRLRRRISAGAEAPGAVPRSRGSDAGKARGVEGVPRRHPDYRSPAATTRRRPTTRSS